MGLLFARVGWQSNWIDILQSRFMRHAFIAGTLVAITSGLIGYFVIARRDSFAAHALAHIGFPGATGAVLVGAPVTLGLVTFCIAGALGIGVLGKQTAEREVATGSVLAFATALGIFFNSQATRSANTVTNVLFGNLLAISTDQLQIFTIFTIVLLASFVWIARPLMFASLDPEVAEAKGVPVRALSVAFLIMLALVVAMAVQVVGTLLLFALVVTPSATALRLSARPIVAIASGTALSAGYVWGGLVLSAMLNLPPSFAIVGLAFTTWLVVRAFTVRQ